MQFYTFLYVIKKMKVNIAAVIIAILLGICVFGIFGSGLLNNPKEEPKDIPTSDVYTAQVEQYTTAIENIKLEIEEYQSVVDYEQDYMGCSTYMQLNSQEYIDASIVFSVSGNEETNYGGIIGEYDRYIHSGFFMEEFCAEYMEQTQKEMDYRFLPEILSGSVWDANIGFTIICVDDDMCIQMMDVLTVIMKRKGESLGAGYGYFSVYESARNIVKKANSDVLNVQNTHSRTYRDNSNAVAEASKRLTQTNSDLEAYQTKYGPYVLGSEHISAKSRIKLILFGAVAGFIILFGIYALGYIIGNVVKSAEDIKASGLNVLAVKRGKEFQPDLSRIAATIQGKLKKLDKRQMVIWSLCDTDKSLVLKKDLEDSLHQLGDYELKFVDSGTCSMGDMEAITNCGNALLVVEIGETIYTSIEADRQLLESLGADILGCVVLDGQTCRGESYLWNKCKDLLLRVKAKCKRK